MTERKNKQLKFLSDADVHKIDQASRRVLSDVGIRFEDDELTGQLMDKDCTNNNGRLQIPSDLVDAAVADLPAEITFGGRNGQKLHIRDGSVSTHTGGSIPYQYDLQTGQKKDFFLQPHTLKHLRNGELLETQVGLYGLINEWEEQGSKSMSENAREKAKSILAVHEDEPLPAEVEREFDRIIKSAKLNLM